MRIVLLTVLVWCQIFCMPVNSQQRPMRGASPYADVLIEGVPHVKQKPDFCGEACAEMYLRKLGYQIDQDMVYEQSGLDPLAGRGCHTNELVRALKKIGFSVGDVWSKVDVGTSGAQLESAWSRLHGDLTRGVPSIVCMRYDDRPKTTEHFRLILGYDSRKDEVIYHEPARASAGYRRMSRARFLDLWPLKYAQREWTLIRLRLASKRKLEVPARARKGRFTQAQYAHHVIALKKKLPGPGFTILLEPPFVVVGDEAAGVVKRRALSTVRWAVTRLKSAYFKKDPKQIIDIWLFKDRRSYLSNVKKLFNDTPGTPFGYYSATHRALVMNISTGGGHAGP